MAKLEAADTSLCRSRKECLLYLHTNFSAVYFSVNEKQIVALLRCVCPIAVLVILSSEARGCQEQSSMLILDIPPNKNSHGSVNLRAI